MTSEQIEYLKFIFNGLNLSETASINSYTDAQIEYEALKYGVGIRINSDLCLLKLTGKDVCDFLHRISTNEINNIMPFEKTDTLFTNEKGRFIDRATFMNFDDHSFLFGSSYHCEKLSRWIERYIIAEDIKLEKMREKFMVFEIMGPQSGSYVSMFCGKCLEELDGKKIMKIDFDGIEILITKFFGNEKKSKYWIIVDHGLFKNFISKIHSHKSAFDACLVGEDAFQYYRIENLIPEAPFEINDNFNPHEVNLIKDVSFSKGCYIGQEVIARLDAYEKVQKELHLVELDGEVSLNSKPLPIVDSANNTVGLLTSFSKALTLNNAIGLAAISKKKLNDQTSLFVENHESKVGLKITGSDLQ